MTTTTRAGELTMQHTEATITVQVGDEGRPWSFTGRLVAVTHDGRDGQEEIARTTVRLGLGDAIAEVQVSPTHEVVIHD